MTYNSARSSFLLVAAFALALPLKAQLADAGPDQYICGTTTMLQANIPGVGESGFWDGGASEAVFVDAANPLTDVNNLPYGVTELTWVHIAPTGATSDVVAIWAYDATMPVANAGIDQTIVGPQNSAQLMGSPAPIWPATCYWNILTGPSIITDPSDPYAMAAGLGVGDNIFVWTCENGPCWSSPTVDTLVIQMMMITGLDEGTQHQPLLVGTRYSNNCSTWGPGASADYCCSMHTAKRCHFT